MEWYKEKYGEDAREFGNVVLRSPRTEPLPADLSLVWGDLAKVCAAEGVRAFCEGPQIIVGPRPPDSDMHPVGWWGIVKVKHGD